VKREGRDRLSISLVQNPDIAQELGARKREGQILVGFAAESSDLIAHASEKIRKKGLDFIVANDITADGAGFRSDTIGSFSSFRTERPEIRRVRKKTSPMYCGTSFRLFRAERESDACRFSWM
jgi:hypothetical protein